MYYTCCIYVYMYIWIYGYMYAYKIFLTMLDKGLRKNNNIKKREIGKQTK